MTVDRCGIIGKVLLVVASTALTSGAIYVLDVKFDLGVREYLGGINEVNIQRAEPIMYLYDNRCGWRLNAHVQYWRKRTGRNVTRSSTSVCGRTPTVSSIASMT